MVNGKRKSIIRRRQLTAGEQAMAGQAKTRNYENQENESLDAGSAYRTRRFPRLLATFICLICGGDPHKLTQAEFFLDGRKNCLRFLV
jgi:hypothetical protein